MADAATSVKNPAATPVDAAAYARGMEDAAKMCDAEALRATLCAGQLRGAEMASATATELARAIRAKIKQATGGKS
jgi:hypothetical protein